MYVHYICIYQYVQYRCAVRMCADRYVCEHVLCYHLVCLCVLCSAYTPQHSHQLFLLPSFPLPPCHCWMPSLHSVPFHPLPLSHWEIIFFLAGREASAVLCQQCQLGRTEAQWGGTLSHVKQLLLHTFHQTKVASHDVTWCHMMSHDVTSYPCTPLHLGNDFTLVSLPNYSTNKRVQYSTINYYVWAMAINT